ncbi:hypothetical protein MKW98_019697 [Papaver atlanticum]|uniref:Rrn7/TAF1B N-terminal cyclin domain-containing protein n=1 Tax=Papaver atlanticum TaxID=357466 RepID=A0AAD4TCR5_9MAGN|nr:hypothetical protein MKW98_019697 [Papaver atlanticum]
MGETRSCDECGGTEFEGADDGYFYCEQCQTRVHDMRDTAIGDEADLYSTGMYGNSQSHAIKEPENIHESEFWRELRKPVGYYACWVRTTYVMGIQLMIESQCQVLVEEFGVSPLICGLSGALWIRFIAASRVFKETWASRRVKDSDMQVKGNGNGKVRLPRWKDKDEPHNSAWERLVLIWLRNLRKKIPLSSCLSICFLSCHIARETILPTDIVNWFLKGKLPYLNVFLRIGEMLAEQSGRCPLSADLMFRPFRVLNFNGLVRRYLKQLQLPQEKILEHASMIYDSAMPPDLWLSPNRDVIPSRVCVMSIIMVAVRILYNINGYGKWEEKYCNANATKSSSSSRRGKRKARETKETKKKIVLGSSYFQNCKSDTHTAELLGSLEMTYEKIREARESSVNLSSYLKLCKDVVFAGAPLDIQEKNKDFECCSGNTASGEPGPAQDDASPGSVKHGSLNRLKSNMEENGFYNIPPRVQVKNVDYLRYETKSNGTRSFVAHADYYILLRVCALVAEVDVQDMHKAALKFEKRLAWLDKNIVGSLKLKAPKTASMPNLGAVSSETTSIML